MYIPSLERFLNGGEVPLNLAKWEDGCFGHGTANAVQPWKTGDLAASSWSAKTMQVNLDESLHFTGSQFSSFLKWQNRDQLRSKRIFQHSDSFPSLTNDTDFYFQRTTLLPQPPIKLLDLGKSGPYRQRKSPQTPWSWWTTGFYE